MPKLDGRLLPDFGPDGMVRELVQLLGNEMRLEATRYDPGVREGERE